MCVAFACKFALAASGSGPVAGPRGTSLVPCADNPGASTAASSIYTTTYEQMNPEFHMSTIVATVGLSTFVLGSKSPIRRRLPLAHEPVTDKAPATQSRSARC